DLLRLSETVIKPFYYQRVQQAIAIIRRYLSEERCLIHKPEGAQVTAQLDFANKEQTEEHYSPNGDASKATLRSRQLNISEQVG
ncbi:hypothetical protein MJM59_33195, partial [Salmonella enterica subsp. enterica serovar Montevideo]|nr:hypothetical protein [Salmonella enterica subsp. enterica serovar Montevideo]